MTTFNVGALRTTPEDACSARITSTNTLVRHTRAHHGRPETTGKDA
jgi:hypothetical protein